MRPPERLELEVFPAWRDSSPGYSWRLGNPKTLREEQSGTEIAEGIKADCWKPFHGDRSKSAIRPILLGGSGLTKDSINWISERS